MKRHWRAAANLEKVKANRRKYYKTHRKEISRKRAKWYAANREQVMERGNSQWII